MVEGYLAERRCWNLRLIPDPHHMRAHIYDNKKTSMLKLRGRASYLISPSHSMQSRTYQLIPFLILQSIDTFSVIGHYAVKFDRF